METTAQDFQNALWLDVEASGLGQDSYPIEVGWCDIDQKIGGVLIQPLPGWIDWDQEAEQLHGITRRQLATEGLPALDAARRIAEAASGKVVYSDSTTFDMKWLYRLFTAVGWDGVPFPLQDACGQVATIVNTRGLSLNRHTRAKMRALAMAPITHRAGADALHWATLTKLVLEA